MSFFDTIVVQPIFNLLMGIYSLIPGGDFGIALIIFTIIVRFLLWPLLKKQLHQTKAMQKMQPELVRIKKEAKGNKQLEGVMMMELYKKHDISPFRSIGILFIQLPIFIALFQVIQIFTTHRDQLAKYTYDFMEGIGPIKALIDHPDQFNEKLFGFLDLTKQAILSHPSFSIDIFLFTLAVISAVTQYIMSKQTSPKKQTTRKLKDIMNDAAEGKQADQSEMNAIVMNNMVKFLPFMMFMIMISLPGALVLYYSVSNIVAVIQQRALLKQDEEEMIEIADQAIIPSAQNKKATLKAREKQAKEANITRIIAKDNTPFKGNKKEKL